MSKRTGNRTGREAKRRRRRHERRMRIADERLATAALAEGMRALEDAMDAAPYTVGVDLAAGPDRTVIFPARSGKTARMADLAALLRSGRIRMPRPELDVEERPLSDAELAMRYAFEAARWNDVHGAAGQKDPIDMDEERARDWSVRYLPPMGSDEPTATSIVSTNGPSRKR